MPIRLDTVLAKVENSVPNKVNSVLIREFHQHLKDNDTSENYQKGNLKAMVNFAQYLGAHTTFYDVKKKEQVLAFLDTKTKSLEVDPDKKWITTWNDYLWRLKLFFRWLYNKKMVDGRSPVKPLKEWETPLFARIKQKRTKRLSPYSETEIWDRDELLTIVRYLRHRRDKAALTLFWDLDARNHEVTLLRLKNIRLRDKYGEGANIFVFPQGRNLRS